MSHIEPMQRTFLNSNFGAFFRYFYPVLSLSLLPNALLLYQQQDVFVL